MVRRLLKYFVGMLLIVLLLSCEKLPETPAGEGALRMDVVQLGGTIPLTWGEFIAVSNSNVTWVQLWFRDKEGNIYTVPYDVVNNRFGMNYRYMKRR